MAEGKPLMADGSTIEWLKRPGTKPASWNPVRGCSRVSRGCGGPGDQGGCYAEGMAARFSLSAAELEAEWRTNPKNAGKVPPTFKDMWGHGFAKTVKTPDGSSVRRWTGKVELIEEMLTKPFSWRDPRTVFANSTSDLFHEKLSDEAIDRIFAVMALTPRHTYLILTKRPERMRKYCADDETPGRIARAATIVIGAFGHELPQGYALTWRENGEDFVDIHPWPLPNVWLGTSVEDQATADERIPLLLDTPAAIRFVSAEPLLGAIDFSRWLGENSTHEVQTQRGIRLPGDQERRLGDHAGRHDLASKKTGLGSLAEEGREPAVQAGPGGARRREILSSQDHAQRGEGLRTRPSAGVPTLQGTDPGRSDGEPRGRQEEAQSSGQPGTGDAFGADYSRSSYAEGGEDRPERSEERDGKADPNSGRNHQREATGRREATDDSRRLRGQDAGSLQDRSSGKVGRLSWLIVGGESGPNARPMNPQWARSLRDQCTAAGVAFFFKQWGEWAPGDAFGLVEDGPITDRHGNVRDWMRRYVVCKDRADRLSAYSFTEHTTNLVYRVGKHRAGRLLDGREWSQFPEART